VTRLLIATGNLGKQREYRRILAALPLELVAPDEIGLDLEVEETGGTFEANAILKASTYADASGLPAIADDSGLEVDALDGLPGVRSSRWVDGSDADRVAALLRRLADTPGDARTARFHAVAALVTADGSLHTAHGTVEGRIAVTPRGEGGFGYDPAFLVEDGDYAGDRTMAELAPEEKDRLSHRGRAVAGLMEVLGSLASGNAGS
jgi:XTP/dITP diphosphohydrolase